MEIFCYMSLRLSSTVSCTDMQMDHHRPSANFRGFSPKVVSLTIIEFLVVAAVPSSFPLSSGGRFSPRMRNPRLHR